MQHAALKNIEKAVVLKNSAPTFQFWYAQLLFKTRKYSKALEALNHFLYIFPWNCRGHQLKASILIRLNRNKEAQKEEEHAHLIQELR